MRIVQACFRFDAPGGAEDHVLQISKEMVRRGHEVTVHTTDVLTETPWKRGSWPPVKEPHSTGRSENASPETEGIRVVRHKAFVRSLSTRLSTLLYPDMLGGLLNERCDLFHAHSHRYFQLEAAACAARATGIPLFITPHYHPAEEKEPLKTRILLKLYDLYSAGAIYRHAKRILTVTDLEKGYMSSFVPTKKCVTVGNGIDPEEWKSIPSPELFRDRYNIDGPYILYSGRLASNKGLEHLFRALPSIFETFGGTMVLVGKDWGMKGELLRMARESKLGKRVKFIDFLADRDLYKAALAGAELFVLPSQWEAFGIVLLEAAMCGKSSVATAIGGIPEVVESGKTGLLVPYGDQKALATAVLSILQDPENAKKMGQSARRAALEKHTWPKVVDRILQAYGQ